MVAILYVVNVLCSAGQSAIGKRYANRTGDAFIFNLNKAIAGVCIFLLYGFVKGFRFHLPTLCFAIAYGSILCLSMHYGFKALSVGPMALTSIIASFSLLIPFGIGILCWNETLSLGKACGIVLLLAAIILINVKNEKGFSLKWLLFAMLTMLGNGICSVVQKLHQINYPGMYHTEFMFVAFLCVLIILVLINTVRVGSVKSYLPSMSGIVCGVMNCSANYILLYLSATENASVIFPIISVANIMAVWGISVIFFGERLTALQTAGLIVGVLSVVLIKL